MQLANTGCDLNGEAGREIVEEFYIPCNVDIWGTLVDLMMGLIPGQSWSTRHSRDIFAGIIC